MNPAVKKKKTHQATRKFAQITREALQIAEREKKIKNFLEGGDFGGKGGGRYRRESCKGERGQGGEKQPELSASAKLAAGGIEGAFPSKEETKEGLFLLARRAQKKTGGSKSYI